MTEATLDSPALPDWRSPAFGLLRLRNLAASLRRTARNPMQAWPADVYTAPYVNTRIAGRDIVFMCDPALVRPLFIDHADLLVRETGTARALAPVFGRGILLADGAAWRSQRGAAAPMFRPARLDAYLPPMIAAAGQTAASWQKLGSLAAIDLVDEMMRLSINMMAATLLSGSNDQEIAGIADAIGDFLQPAAWPVLLSMLGSPPWLPYPGARAARRACRDARRLVRNLIVARRARHQDSAAPDDLLDHLLAAASPGKGRGMTDTELTDNLLSFIAAGHETTALALFWLFQLLADAPAVEARLVNEIAEVTGGGELAPDMLNRLVYTRQVVNEALRLYPPVPATMWGVARDVMIGPCRLRSGTSIVLPIVAIHRHESLWRAPDVFDPARFGPERAAARDRFAFIPFGLGPRSCIGMGFAMSEILAAVAVLAPRFALRRAAGGAPPCRQHITLRPDGDTRMILKPRPAGWLSSACT